MRKKIGRPKSDETIHHLIVCSSTPCRLNSINVVKQESEAGLMATHFHHYDDSGGIHSNSSLVSDENENDNKIVVELQ